MRRFCLSLAAFVAVGVAAQDVITKRDGDEVQAKVTEITDTDVKYKKWSNPDGPTYTVKRAEVFMIKYQNGEKDVFKDEAPAAAPRPTAQTPTAVDYSDKEANAAAVAAFNSFRPQLAESDKKSHGAVLIFGLAEGSVIEDSNISLSFENAELLSEEFRVLVRNKTDRTVYLDLANSFVSRDGVAEPYYIPTATNTTHGTSSGVGVSLGVISPVLSGISVGGGASSSTSTTVFSQRVVAIPPHSVTALEKMGVFVSMREDTEDKQWYVKRMDNFVRQRKEAGWFRDNLVGYASEMLYPCLNFDKKSPLLCGEWLTYDEKQLSYRLGIHCSYSLTEDLSGLAAVSSRLYFKHVVGFSGPSYERIKRGFWGLFPCIESKNVPGCDKVFGVAVPVDYKKKLPILPRP